PAGVPARPPRGRNRLALSLHAGRHGLRHHGRRKLQPGHEPARRHQQYRRPGPARPPDGVPAGRPARPAVNRRTARSPDMTLILILLILLAAAAAFVLSNRELRINRLSRPLYQVFRRILPRMSDTERDALEAGTVWWDGDLFRGRPRA